MISADLFLDMQDSKQIQVCIMSVLMSVLCTSFIQVTTTPVYMLF